MSRINYQLRPTKHVERKIFVEILTHLRGLGCNISKYHYMGLGAPYFVDFLLFHKHLYIKKMTSFENDSGLFGRVNFNKPLAHINVLEEDATATLPTHIKENEKYVIWLDYECNLNKDILDVVGLLAGILPEGSILIVTVNTHLPGVSNEEARDLEVKRYLDLFSGSIPGIQDIDITPNTLGQLCAKAMKAQVEEGALARGGENFVQLFNYTYADGAPMLTFGGIFKEEDESFEEEISKLRYVHQDDAPCKISVPALTHKERIWLDKYGSPSRARVAATGLTADEIKQYFEFEAHYPTYYEIAI